MHHATLPSPLLTMSTDPAVHNVFIITAASMTNIMCCSLEENQVVVVCNVCMYVGMHVHVHVHICTVYICTCIYVCIEVCGLYVVTIRSVLNIASGAFNGGPIASVVIPMYGSFSTIRSQLSTISVISLL